MAPSAISFIYKSLGCLHSLQPAANDDGFGSPSVPALKPKGFVIWQTIQLLLGPEEHVLFLQTALREFDVKDPDDGKPLPKMLPKEAFPENQDPSMLQWYEQMTECLRRESEAASSDHPASQPATEDPNERRSVAAVYSYFDNPRYVNREGRPEIVRRGTSHQRSPRENVFMTGGRMVATTMKHIVSPNLWSSRSSPTTEGHRHSSRRHSGSATWDWERGDATPTGRSPERRSPAPHAHARYVEPGHHRSSPRPPPRRHSPSSRRPSSIKSSTSSSSDTLPPAPPQNSFPNQRRHSPQFLRHHRSAESPASPRDYFPYSFYFPERRRNSSAGIPPPPPFPPPASGQRPPSRPILRRSNSHIRDPDEQNHGAPKPSTSSSGSYAYSVPHGHPRPDSTLRSKFGPSVSPVLAYKVFQQTSSRAHIPQPGPRTSVRVPQHPYNSSYSSSSDLRSSLHLRPHPHAHGGSGSSGNNRSNRDRSGSGSTGRDREFEHQRHREGRTSSGSDRDRDRDFPGRVRFHNDSTTIAEAPPPFESPPVEDVATPTSTPRNPNLLNSPTCMAPAADTTVSRDLELGRPCPL